MDAATPLHEVESAAGAHFGPWFGWEMPEDFGDARAEYEALQQGAGLIDVCFQGKLRVTGRDRTRYLNNMLTNDLRDLPEGSGCYAALLTRQGLMESDLWVHVLAGETWLECPPSGIDHVEAALRKHIVSEDVRIENRTGVLGLVSLQGPKAGIALERVLGIPPADLPAFGHRPIDAGSVERRVVRRDRTGCGGYDLWLPAPEVPAYWTRLSRAAEVRPAGMQAWNRARTEAGIPWYGMDMDERSLPMEMGLDAAISLNKGCYRGQEIVARITYRSRLDRRLGGVAVDGRELPPAGSVLLSAGEKIGETTSAVYSPRLDKPLALAVIKLAFLAPGTRVEVRWEEIVRAGEVVALPLAPLHAAAPCRGIDPER